MRSFLTFTYHEILLGRKKHEEWDGQCMWHVLEGGEMCNVFRWRNRREIDNLEVLTLDGRIMSILWKPTPCVY